MAERWSAEEDASLVEASSSHTYEELARMTGRTEVAVRGRCMRLGVRARSARRWWTEEDNAQLRELTESCTAQEIAEHTGRTRKAITWQCEKLGIAAVDGRTTEEARARVSARRTRFRVDDDGRECSKCGQYKPWDQFNTGNGARGRKSLCIPCQAAEFKEQYYSDLEASRARGRAAQQRYADRVNPDRKRYVPCFRDENGRECPRCREYKTWDELHHWTTDTGGKAWGVCKSCWRESVRKSRYLRLYGISVEDFERLEAEQGGVCALCGEAEDKRHPKSGQLFYMSIDHDHGCGQGHVPERACKHCIRGLTCYNCNVFIGFAERRARLREMITDYLGRRPLLEVQA